MQAVGNARELSQRHQGGTQVELQIDGLLNCLATLRELPQSTQRLLKVCYRLPVGRACRRLVASLAAVDHSPVPHRTAQGVMRQQFDLLGQAVRVEPIQGRYDAGV